MFVSILIVSIVRREAPKTLQFFSRSIKMDASILHHLRYIVGNERKIDVVRITKLVHHCVANLEWNAFIIVETGRFLGH